MYDEKQKQKFISLQIDNVTTSKYFYSSLFNRSEEYERAFERDLSLFSLRQVELMYRSLRFTSLNVIKVTNSVYKTYTDWCEKNGKAVNNIYSSLSERDLVGYLDVDGVRNQFVTREMIYKWCDLLPNPSDKFLLLGLFEGICGKEYCEFVHLRTRDVYSDTLELNLYNRGRIKVSPRLIQYAVESAETTRYYSISGKQKKIGQYKESDLVIKEYASVQPTTDDYWSGRRIYKKYLRVAHFLFGSSEPTSKNISDSGIIEMIRRRSMELGISNKDYIIHHSDEIARQYGRSIQGATFLRKYSIIG